MPNDPYEDRESLKKFDGMTCVEMRMRLILAEECEARCSRYEELAWKWMTKAGELMDQVFDLKELKQRREDQANG